MAPEAGAEERIAIESDADVVAARQRARELAVGLDLTSTDQTLLATAISEVARNITTYAQRGEVLLAVIRENGPPAREGIRVIARDDGPGIEDVERALQDGYTSGSGLGLGLPGARRLVDEFAIERAAAGHDGHPGQVVQGEVAGDDEDWPPALERGVAGTPLAGEARSGDLAVFAGYDGGGLAAVLDGLGHGSGAADASARAAEVIRRRRRLGPAELLAACHEALRSTRGAVMTVAWFDLERLRITWAGVGNVEARLVRGGAAFGERHDSALVMGGVVGFKLPPVRPRTMDLRPGDAVAFATDGLESDFTSTLSPGLPAQRLAERLLERHAKGTDDALAAVVRYRG